MITVASVVVVVVLAIVCLVIIVKISEAKHKARNEWLEELLKPSVSLQKLMFTLYNTTAPRDVSIGNPFFNSYGNHNKIINLRVFRSRFSENLMWQLVDIFVRNAEQHFKVLSFGEGNSYDYIKNGDGLITAISTQIIDLYGYNSRQSINNAPLSDEVKQKLLT